jgi:VWFA-related protein
MICESGGKMARGRWCCFALFCATINASAQTVPGDGTAGPKLIPRTKAEREAQIAAHRRILLNVQVTDPSGLAVTGLNAQNFTLQINHHPETITSFQAVEDGGATAHAHAFLVIDVLNNSARDLDNAHKAIEKLAGSEKLLPLPTSLVFLTEKGTEVSNTSRNAQEVATELERGTRNYHSRDCTEDWNNAALGKTITATSVADSGDRMQNREETADRISDCLNKKYQLSLTALLDLAHHQKDVPGRAILIWIGPGWPILSGPEFTPDTPDVRQSFFANLVQVSTELREGQVTLDAVSWPASSPIAKLNPADLETLMRGTSTAAQASARSVAMPVLAHISGGQVYMHEKNLTPELAACLADANSYYVLGFDAVPSTGPDEFRAIEVTVDKPGEMVRTNTAYYAQP